MDVLLSSLLGFIFAIILHELTHLLVITYYKIPFKAVILTKWTAFGFLIKNENYVNDDKKLFLVHFLPMIWCVTIVINPSEPFFIMFPLVNVFGGVGDMYYYFKMIPLPPYERIEWANKTDEKALKSIIWKKEF